VSCFGSFMRSEKLLFFAPVVGEVMASISLLTRTLANGNVCKISAVQ
jgi:hypothetical protein